MDWLTDTPIAHRGLHDASRGIPENSLAAFAAATEAGYAIELDLRLSADGEAMVFHDAVLDRLTPLRGPLAARSAAELAAARLQGTAERMPRLADVLRLVAGRAPLLVEVKRIDRGVGPLEAAAWRELARYEGPFAVQSFSPWSMGWFRRHAPAVRRGQLAGDGRSYGRGWPPSAAFMLRRLWLNAVSRPHFIGYDVRALPYWAPALARRRGLPVLAWTVKTAADRETAARHADNIIFEGFRP